MRIKLEAVASSAKENKEIKKGLAEN